MEKILIVDDNPKNIQLLGNILSERNYDVEYAQDGLEAVELVGSDSFDLILMDVMMPKMDGFEACKRIKEMESKSEIPIIFITAKTDVESITRGFGFGGVDYISKPFNAAELLARVEAHISLKQARHDLIIKNTLLTDSIKYAQQIQNALLPSNIILEDIFLDHFLIYLPKDVVSGDFYWVRKIEHLILIAVGDCTGHGVPGAFMSMLGISMLNEMGTKVKLENPNIFLSNMRRKLKNSWKASNVIGDYMDGIDMAMCMINTNNLSMQFAGALRSAYIIRNKNLIEVKGDRQPIGFHPNETEFTNHHIELIEKDRLYFFSDGYPDQLGGEKGKKFLIKNFRKLLLELQDYSMNEQKEILMKNYQKWKGNMEPTDDILVFGIQF